jgi:hypothetical protein
MQGSPDDGKFMVLPYSVGGSQRLAGIVICRAIKTLHKFKPPATEEEVRASSLQFVRKLSGFTRPSKANQLAFERAVGQITKAAQELLDSLVTNAPPRHREVVAARARAKAADRFRVRPEKSPGA